MNILIVGCHRVGTHLAQELDVAGHEVSVLDETEAAFSLLDSANDYDFGGMLFTGIPIDIDSLRSAGIENVDALICVTPDDNTNLMVCQIATEIFNVPQVVCRVTDPTLSRVYNELYPFQVICPTDITAEAILALVIKDKDSPGFFTFAGSTVGFSLSAVPSTLIGNSLDSIPRSDDGKLLFGVMRVNKKIELSSLPSPIMQKGDYLVWSSIKQ